MRDPLRLIPFDGSILVRFAGDPPDLRRRARLIALFSMMGFTGGVSLAATHYFFFDIPAPH